jgi:ABC-type nitrate/sulfonate/bicarbonate transport system permease component
MAFSIRAIPHVAYIPIGRTLFGGDVANPLVLLTISDLAVLPVVLVSS